MTRLVAVLVVLALSGCGVGPGEAQKGGGADLRVTRDFGRVALGPPAHRDSVRESDTVMRFLQAERKVTTRFGGGFVQSIDGLAGDQAAERDWFYYVNGSEASKGAADYGLSAGDVVQWDYHDWQATQHIPVIVGAYPEPFVHGQEGKLLPLRVECTDEDSAACGTVTDRLGKLGVTVTEAPVGAPAGDKTLRVIVGRFADVDEIGAAAAMTEGPATTGVYARFDSDGETLSLLDSAGHVAREAPPGTGLVAATQQAGGPITWLVTGVDDAGVGRAATALDAATLRNAFAVAVVPGGGVQRLPVVR